MATTIIEMKDGRIASASSRYGIEVSTMGDYAYGGRGWEVMVFPPMNGHPAEVECVKHSPSSGKVRYRKVLPLKEGEYRLISGAQVAPHVTFRSATFVAWAEKKGVERVSREAPNRTFKLRSFYYGNTARASWTLATDGKVEVISAEYKRMPEHSICSDVRKEVRVSGASWVLITQDVFDTGSHWRLSAPTFTGGGTLYHTGRGSVMKLLLPDKEEKMEGITYLRSS